jgi:hypothetical protein
MLTDDLCHCWVGKEGHGREAMWPRDDGVLAGARGLLVL